MSGWRTGRSPFRDGASSRHRCATGRLVDRLAVESSVGGDSVDVETVPDYAVIDRGVEPVACPSECVFGVADIVAAEEDCDDRRCFVVGDGVGRRVGGRGERATAARMLPAYVGVVRARVVGLD